MINRHRTTLTYAGIAILAIIGAYLLWGCETVDAVSDEALTTLETLPPAEITPDVVSDMTGGSVSTEDVEAEARELQAKYPQMPWPQILLTVAATLTTRKVAPHLLGPALPFITGLNPILGLIGSLAVSTTETNRVRSGKGLLWRKPETLAVKSKK